MRELFFVLIVILVLLALTAIRYRKQIVGIIQMARMLKEAKGALKQGKTIQAEQPSVHLVNCPECGIWVPSDKAKGPYCSGNCRQAAKIKS